MGTYTLALRDCINKDIPEVEKCLAMIVESSLRKEETWLVQEGHALLEQAIARREKETKADKLGMKDMSEELPTLRSKVSAMEEKQAATEKKVAEVSQGLAVMQADVLGLKESMLASNKVAELEQTVASVDKQLAEALKDIAVMRPQIFEARANATSSMGEGRMPDDLKRIEAEVKRGHDKLEAMLQQHAVLSMTRHAEVSRFMHELRSDGVDDFVFAIGTSDTSIRHRIWEFLLEAEGDCIADIVLTEDITSDFSNHLELKPAEKTAAVEYLKGLR